jgi:hypothetical protein
MKTLIILLIFSMAFIGFYINGYKINEPERNEISEKLEKNELGSNKIETNEKIYNEMGDLLNPEVEKIENIQVIDTTTFKGEGLNSAKPYVNASLKIVDDNGLSVNFGSYEDNFPYEASYLKTVNSENKIAATNAPIIKKKNKSVVSKVILPDGVKDYVEDFSFYRRATNMVKDTINTKDKILLIPDERIIAQEDRIRNILPDEIVFKTKPDVDEFSRARNSILVADIDKQAVFYETSRKIDESKSLFNLE